MEIKQDLNMEMVFQKINEYKNKKIKLENSMILKINEKYDIKIFRYDDDIMSFKIDEEYFSTFVKPVTYKIVINDSDSIIADIISFIHLTTIVRNYHFNQLMIYCPQCWNKYYDLSYFELERHEKHKDACLKESSPLHKLSEVEFNTFFKENYNFVGKKLNPLKFEPNFQKYFKDSKYIIASDEFDFIEDKHKKRLKLTKKLEILSIGNKLIQFFGQPGKGKTLTLIGFLKYMIDHSSVGTLYINCKAMFYLDDPYQIKKLFIDEIPFLFYNL